MSGHRLRGQPRNAIRRLTCDAPDGCGVAFDGEAAGEGMKRVRDRARRVGWICRDPGCGSPARDLCPKHHALAVPALPPHGIEPDGSARVPIGDGFTVIIDAADLPLIAPYAWHPLLRRDGRAYAMAARRQGLPSPRTVYMHRLIAGSLPGEETDHRNEDSLDNRRENLRRATPGQNRANAGKPRPRRGRPSTSRFKGVNWCSTRNKWCAKITVGGVTRNLGRYEAEAAAARAYDAAALAAWGEFARLNFPASGAA